MATAAVDLELERAEPGVLPPGPRVPALVQFLHLGFRPIAFLEECDRRYGTPFTLRIPARPPLVMFSDPEAIREIFTGDPELLRAGEANNLLEPMLGQHSLLLLDGPRHLRERRLMLPPFHGERMTPLPSRRSSGWCREQVTSTSIASRVWSTRGGS